MSNDEKVQELSKKITVKLKNSSSLPSKQESTPDLSALRRLAEKIRNSIEDYSVEATVHSKSS